MTVQTSGTCSHQGLTWHGYDDVMGPPTKPPSSERSTLERFHSEPTVCTGDTLRHSEYMLAHLKFQADRQDLDESSTAA